jgi:hypothetical protein
MATGAARANTKRIVADPVWLAASDRLAPALDRVHNVAFATNIAPARQCSMNLHGLGLPAQQRAVDHR